MDILKIIIFKHIFGYIFQGFAIILGVYLFNKEKLKAKEYVFASLLLIVSTYLVKLLPISYGVHTILNLLVLFFICTFMLDMQAFLTVRSSLLVTVLLLLSEIVNVAIMIAIFGQKRFELFMNNPIDKAIIGVPASITFVLIEQLLQLHL